MPRYKVPATANISLSANTPKTVIGVISASNRRVRLTGFSVSFDSVTGTDNSVLCEIVRNDGTSAGSGSTSVTPVPIDSAETAALSTAAINWATTEPTTYTVVDVKRITPVGGTLIEPFDFLDQPVQASGTTRVIGIRLTSAQAQSNVRCTLTFEE